MTDPRTSYDLGRIGGTGLVQHGGVVREEWLTDLQGTRWRAVVKKMTDQDAIIGGVLFAIEMLLRRITYEVAPAGDTPEDEAAAAYLGECFAALRPAWLATLPEALSMLPWGWAVLEIVYQRRPDGRVGWEAWEIRGQDTLDRWAWDDGAVTPSAMVQTLPTTYQTATIPLDKCIHLTTTSRKGNPEGRSILRNAYRSWYYKAKIENIEGIGVERDLAGLPVAYVPPELLSAATRTAEQTTAYNAIVDIVTNIRRDSQEGVVWPLAYDANGKELYRLELLSASGSRQFDTGAIIDRYGAQIAMSMLADFLMLGHEQVGSFALSADKTELFTVALGAFADSLCEAVTVQAFDRLLALNGMAGRATLTHGALEQADLATLGAYLAALTSAGAKLFPNDTLLAALLREAGLAVEESALAATRAERAAMAPDATPQPPQPDDSPDTGQQQEDTP